MEVAVHFWVRNSYLHQKPLTKLAFLPLGNWPHPLPFLQIVNAFHVTSRWPEGKRKTNVYHETRVVKAKKNIASIYRPITWLWMTSKTNHSNQKKSLLRLLLLWLCWASIASISNYSKMTYNIHLLSYQLLYPTSSSYFLLAPYKEKKALTTLINAFSVSLTNPCECVLKWSDNLIEDLTGHSYSHFIHGHFL